jgi:cell division protein FtsN
MEREGTYGGNRRNIAMPANEEGEFELVLGNKHLLSVFFVVVLLLGVFFMMGYVMGRNLSPEEQVAASPGRPIEVEAAAPTKSSAPAPDRPTPMPDATPAVVSQARPEPAPPIQAAPPKPQPVKPAPVQAAAPKPQPAKPAPVQAAPRPQPVKPAPAAAGGTYLQVVATTPDGAARVTQDLTQRGFRATTQAVPDSTLVRVLVGPLDGAAMATTREDLQRLGYSPFVRRM